MLRLLEKLMNVIINIFGGECPKRKKAVTLGFKFGLPKLKKKGNNMPAEISITNEQKVPVTLTPETDSGKPAKLDGKPSVSIVSGNSQVANVSEDGLSFELVSSDDPGDTVVLVKADADLGEGIEEISDTITLRVIGATAKNLGISVGTPVPKD